MVTEGAALLVATGWAKLLLQGPLAVTIATLAIIFLGFGMLTGRVSIKAGARAVLGCFILLGSSALADNLLDMARTGSAPASINIPAAVSAPALMQPLSPTPLPASAGNRNPFDPYANQSGTPEVNR